MSQRFGQRRGRTAAMFVVQPPALPWCYTPTLIQARGRGRQSPGRLIQYWTGGFFLPMWRLVISYEAMTMLRHFVSDIAIRLDGWPAISNFAGLEQYGHKNLEHVHKEAVKNYGEVQAHPPEAVQVL